MLLVYATKSKLEEAHLHTSESVDYRPTAESPNLPLLQLATGPATCSVASWPILQAKAIQVLYRQRKTYSKGNSKVRLHTRCRSLSKASSKVLTRATIHNLLW